VNSDLVKEEGWLKQELETESKVAPDDAAEAARETY